MTSNRLHPDQHHADRSQSAEAICTDRIVIPTFNAEFVPELDGGPCGKPAVLRVTVYHDGTTCGGNGHHRMRDEHSSNRTLLDPQTEVILLCDDHAFEYRAHYSDQPQPDATVEELS